MDCVWLQDWGKELFFLCRGAMFLGILTPVPKVISGIKLLSFSFEVKFWNVSPQSYYLNTLCKVSWYQMTQTELLLQWQVISYRIFTTFIWFICSDSLASIKMVYFNIKYTCCHCFYLSIFDRTVLPCWFSTESLFTLADHRDWWVPVVSQGEAVSS